MTSDERREPKNMKTDKRPSDGETSKPRIEVFGDLDGVLAIYTREDYIPPTTWDKNGSHYFRHRPPDEHAIEAMRRLASRPDVRLWVLSTLAWNPSTNGEHTIDKMEWTREHLPEAEMRIIVSEKPKHEVARKALERNLTATDVLVDDYNENLVCWRKAGGTAVKYLNGLNSRDSWPYAAIHAEHAAEGLAAIIDALM
jgi:hypothetical protein